MKRRRTRYPDKYKVGSSTLVPFIQNEAWNERHARRINEALANSEEVQIWCRKHRWWMLIKNNGHHWIFKTDANKMIEWWPSSGKLIIGKQWNKGIHCHDYTQLIRIFEEAYNHEHEVKPHSLSHRRK